MDAFLAAAFPDLCKAMDGVGVRMPQASLELSTEHVRGGPHILGGVFREAWTVTIAGADAVLIATGARQLPFVVISVRMKIEESTGSARFDCEEFLDKLPGRLGPRNVVPRSAHAQRITAKLTTHDLDELRGAVEGKDSERSRRLLEYVAPELGSIWGAVEVHSPAANIVIARGDSEKGRFTIFLFSTGNVGPRDGDAWHVPLWIMPFGMGPWTNHNCEAFLQAAIRHAAHRAIEGGVIDEELTKIARRLPALNDLSLGRIAEIHRPLVGLHSSNQELIMLLEQGANRSISP